MRVFLKLVHYLAVSAYVGSIFGHILLGEAFSVVDIAAYRTILQAKAALTDALILGGIALSMPSGVGLIIAGGGKQALRPWLLVKLAAVALITANTLLFLRPIGLERIELASDVIAGTQTLDALMAAGMQENMFGAANLVLVLVVIVLSVARRVPFPRASRRPVHA